MKVVNITEEARWGGPQVRIIKVASRLNEYGVETTVLHPTLDSKRLVEKAEHLDIQRKEVDLYRLTKDVFVLAKYFLFFVRDVYNIIKVIEEVGPDLVHCNGCWQIKGMLAAGLSGVPAVWHLNDTHMPKSVRTVFRILAEFTADGFVLASKRTEDYYISGTNLSCRPSSVIQAPVDTREFDPTTIQRHTAIGSRNTLKVVTVASINPIKGIEDFIGMAKEVYERASRDVEFIIVGPVYDSQKQYGRRLKSRAERSSCNIRFIGHSDEIPQILRTADVYVCSSKSEASPISVWEAMAMGLPVISTDVGDVRRFLESSERPAGAVVKVGDSKKLADNVIRFLEDEELRSTYGDNARRVAKTHLDIDICARQHAEFYSEVLQRTEKNDKSSNSY
jgi:glycosyltransferase involved in cell wall biosynthesis